MDPFPSNLQFQFLLLSLLCSIMFNSVICSLKVHCNEKDMNTLLRFRQRLTDPSQVLSSWSPKFDCCQWNGVKCDNFTGRVTQLNLPCHTYQHKIVDFGDKDDKSHCLTGKLNLILLELEFLNYLDLSNNDFKSIQYNSKDSRKCNEVSRGNISQLCGNSTKLNYLDLSYNYDLVVHNFHWISCHMSLQYLNLGGVSLPKETDWLQSVTMLPSLLELHFESCQLQNLYPSLQYANFTSLQVLDLADNDFVYDELPSWLFNLSCDISHIDLSHNQIHSQLPKSLPNFRSLNSLVLSDNYLKGPIPNWLGQLEQLENLHLSFNYFSGPIPASLGNLSSLIHLELQSNELNGNLPLNIGQLFKLESLGLGSNSFTGILSERNLLSLSYLKFLYVSSPALIFDFDPEWIPPFQLTFIYLDYVRDKLPAWLFTQTSLVTLMIEDSTASFEPLDKFWNFATQLDYLILQNNTINGDMSNVLLSSKYVWLESNNLRGGVPRISTQVVVLYLNSNSLSGSISPLLCDNTIGKNNLMVLGIADNNLSGELTHCWNHWKSLFQITFEKNNLTGKIPDSMGSLSNLRLLNLKSNNFFGEVPISLKNCKNLWVLHLSNNNLSGVIPSWFGHNVKALLLRSNRFSGNIPAQLCQHDSLMVMDLASNRLSGPIPNCLHNITAMHSVYHSTSIHYTLHFNGSSITIICGVRMFTKGNELIYTSLMNLIDLSNNNLSGSVPLEIYKLTGLQSLNLSHNQLLGEIPKEIGNLLQLESLDLSSNHFSGQIPESMSALHYLSALNLSCNNLVGKIPSGTQLGSTNLSYIGNPGLCGAPLTKICPQDKKSHKTERPMGEQDDDDKFQVYSMFYMGLGIGFAVGFLGVLGAIFFNTRCRHAYFRFLQRIYDFVIQKMNFLY